MREQKLMAIKKTELYSRLWKSCDELRGGMDASQYKDYVLTLLFVKYVSDKYAGDPDAVILVPEGGSFQDMLALKNDKDIGDKINKIISKLAEENDLKGVIDVADFNNDDKLGKGKDMVDRLTNLLGTFEGLNLKNNRADGDDLLGDAYEYLMRHFATESGKSKGQFYTPAEVSRILAKVIGVDENTPQDKTVYDPTCGSGSLLLKVEDEAGDEGLSLYGQENDNATAALAKMNMILHESPTALIWKDNTLSAPHWTENETTLRTFDFAVANPPFSYKSWSNGLTPESDPYGRFEYGTPPDKNGDYAFLLHIIKSLKSTGKGAVILPHGVLFRGNTEADIRRNLIRQGFIKGIIGLPANLFYGTGIPACIIVIDKEQASANKPIFMIDASRGFIKDGNKNRLRAQDIHKIVDVFNKQLVVPKYSRLVPYDEIEKNEFNLNIPRYIDASEAEDIHDLTAHIHGGIPTEDINALGDYWSVFPTLRKSLFKASDIEGYSDALVKASEVKTTILNHPEFKAFSDDCVGLYTRWKTTHHDRLHAITVGENPKQLIHELGEDLLGQFAEAKLLSKYSVYQLLMDYWNDVMQDDVYILAQDGWAVGSHLRELVPTKDKKGKSTYAEDHDFEVKKKRYKSDLVPPALVMDYYFADEKQQQDDLTSQMEQATQALDEFIEEHSGDEGLIEEARNDKGNVSKTTINARLKQADDADEVAVLKQCLKLMADEADKKKAVKEATEALDMMVFEKIPTLTEDEIKTLVIEHKWHATLQHNVQADIERVTQQLANRVKTLEERYAEPLPAILKSVTQLSNKVDGHLAKMGVKMPSLTGGAVS